MFVFFAFLYRFGGKSDEEKDETQKEEPNFALSGKLTAETNTYKVSFLITLHIHNIVMNVCS